jgi:hypothetical protein
MRDNLLQALLAVFEELLTESNSKGGSTYKPKGFEFYELFVMQVLNPQYCIISFNYDCVIYYALKWHGSGKWNSHYGYGLSLKRRGSNLHGDDYW